MENEIRKRHEPIEGSQARLTVRYLDEIVLLRKVLIGYLKRNNENMRDEMIGIGLYRKIDKHLKNNGIV